MQIRGAVLTEVLRASGAAGSAPAPGGPLGPLAALGQQLAGTFLFGVPSLFGSRTLCGPDCPLWPSPLSNPSLADALRIALIGASLSALFIVCWWLAAHPLLRDLRRIVAHRRSARLTPAPAANPESTSFLAAPLIAAPLLDGASKSWAWLRSYTAGHRPIAMPPRLAILATTLLLALCAVQLAGAVNAFQETADTARYAVPAGSRETALFSFLDTHHATRFYTTWWVCYRLMTDEGARRVSAQLAGLIAARDPRFAGYTAITVGGYVVFYYAGP